MECEKIKTPRVMDGGCSEMGETPACRVASVLWAMRMRMRTSRRGSEAVVVVEMARRRQAIKGRRAAWQAKRGSSCAGSSECG